MRRRLFNAAVIASMLLLATLCVIWARSYGRGYGVTISRSAWPSADACLNQHLTIRLVLGHWVVTWARNEYDLTVADATQFHHAMDPSRFRDAYAPGVRWQSFGYHVQLGRRRGLGGGQIIVGPDAYYLQVPLWHGFGSEHPPPRTYRGRTDAGHKVVAPAWPAAVLLGVLPVVWVVRHARRGKRARAGCCTTCGYDLRATPDRCPECGTRSSAEPVPTE